MESNICKVCGGKDFSFLFTTFDRVYPIDREFRIIKCRKCGSLFVEPLLSVEELKKHYPRAYYESITGIRFNNKKTFFSSIKSKIITKLLCYYYNYPFPVNSRFNLLEKLCFFLFKVRFSILGESFIPWDGKGKLLDVGCGMGTNLSRLKKFGWNTYGVELDEYAAGYSRELGHNIFCGTLLDAKFPSNFFDVIMFKDVLEHLDNPVEVLKEACRILKSGGRVYILVPISNNLFFNLFKGRWYSLDTPRHLWIPSTKAINILCHRAGMRVKKVRYKRGGEILGSIQYLINDRGTSRVYLNDVSRNRIYRNKFLMRVVSFLEYFLERLNLTGTVDFEIIKV